MHFTEPEEYAAARMKNSGSGHQVLSDTVFETEHKLKDFKASQSKLPIKTGAFKLLEARFPKYDDTLAKHLRFCLFV